MKKYEIDGLLSDFNMDAQLVGPLQRKFIKRDGKLFDNTSRRIAGAIVEVEGDAGGQSKALSLIGSIDWIVLKCM